MAAATAQYESTWSEIGEMRMHALAAGEGPPVVLVHGYGVSGAYMLPLADALVPHCSVLVPELPGQGRSSAPPGRWGISEMADALGSWLDSAQLERPVVVANSMGCQVATQVTLERPDLVGSLVLIGPTVDPARRNARHQLLGLLRAARREPFSMVKQATRDCVTADTRGLVGVTRSVLEDRIEDRLPLIRQPAVVVYGDADTFIGREWAERCAELLPLGRLVVVPGAAHIVHYTRPTLVAAIARGLVEERDHQRRDIVGRLQHRDVAAA
jgi:pimeloyl-ACP methyl ester carboxylesterase